MSDVIAELRRLYEAAPQDEWTCEGPDFHGYRIFSADEKVLNHTLTEAVETADLIVAMHEALPALLDAVEALRWYADEDNYNFYGTAVEPTPAGNLMPDEGERARAALAALERSDEG